MFGVSAREKKGCAKIARNDIFKMCKQSRMRV